MRMTQNNQRFRKAARPFLLLGLAVAASGLTPVATAMAAEAEAPAPDDAAKIAEQICATCHGPHGASTTPIYPVLAAQHEEYLAAQLRAFKERTRSDPEAHNYMWTMATLVNESMIESLARYYAAQSPVPGQPGDASDTAKGKALFETGVPARGIMACSNCHGQNAEGHWVFPRLAGQRSQYVFRQLQVIQGHLRESPVMHGIIRDLKPSEMQDLGVYLQSLP
jgi:cytochrome c553